VLENFRCEGGPPAAFHRRHLPASVVISARVSKSVGCDIRSAPLHVGPECRYLSLGTLSFPFPSLDSRDLRYDENTLIACSSVLAGMLDGRHAITEEHGPICFIAQGKDNAAFDSLGRVSGLMAKPFPVREKEPLITPIIANTQFGQRTYARSKRYRTFDEHRHSQLK
jgi:hypothetical protein